MDGGYAAYSDIMGYTWLSEIAMSCGHPASTVTVTPPGLDTCEGAFAKNIAVNNNICRREQNADGHAEHTPASCGHAECAELISSIDDDALAKMKTGLQVCA